MASSRRTTLAIDPDTQERLDWLRGHYGIGMAAIVRIAIRTLWRRQTGLEEVESRRLGGITTTSNRRD